MDNESKESTKSFQYKSVPAWKSMLRLTLALPLKIRLAMCLVTAPPFHLLRFQITNVCAHGVSCRANEY